MMVFSGNAHCAFAKACCAYLDLPLADAEVNAFPDGETSVVLKEDIRGSDVFIVQPTCPPVNQNLMQLLLMVDCAKRASARRITVVIPYFGYARQDRKDKARVPITAKLVANLITIAGADRVLSVDLHSPQIQGFFDIPVDHLYARPVMVKALRERDLIGDSVVVVSPDLGSIKMARAYARHLHARLATIDKRRIDASSTSVEFVIGEVKDKIAVLVDDMISTAGTIADGVRAIHEHGARKIYLCATHGLFCGKAFENLAKAPVEEILVSDSIAHEVLPDRTCVISLAPLVGEAMRRIHANESVSSLFD